MYLIILFNLILLLYLLKYLYLRYLLHILDCIAHILAKIIIYFNIKNINNIVDYNLNLVIDSIKLRSNKKIDINIESIKFKSNKLAILNTLLALHQKYIIDTNYIIKHYSEFKIPKQLEFDLKHNKCIFALAHYGIYYDFSSIYTLFSPISWIYKMSNQIVENMVYDSKNFEGKILPIKHDKLQDYLYNDFPLMCIPCDQKASSIKDKINFLGQPVHFHTSPVDIHKITKRSLWVYFCKYNFETKKMDIKVIPVQRIVNNNKKYAITQKVADLFTEEILNNPEQYFWVHNRFNYKF